jgi:FkbM family methyltransferase
MPGAETNYRSQKSWGANLVRMVVPRTVRNWLRSPAKSGRWLSDAVSFYAGRTKMLPLTPSLNIICHPEAYRAAVEAQVNDLSQRAEFQYFLSLCNASMHFFDIGAHYGVFSVAAALKGAKAIAVEPSAIAADMIKKQARLNGCDKKIQIVRAAASDSSGTIALLSSGVFSHGYFKVARGRPERELTRTAATTIDQLICRFGVPTHIKIDVEGHEAAVLRGARKLLTEHAPILLLELHNDMIRSDGGDPDAAFDELTKLGFNAYACTGRLLSKAEILSESIIRVIGMKDSERP